MNRAIMFICLLFSVAQIACQDSAPQTTATASPMPQTIVTATPSVSSTAATTNPNEMKTTPSGLKYQDLEVGNGISALMGQTLTVKYVGKLANGKEFEKGKIDYKVGDQDYAKGWNLGIMGGDGIPAMKVGGTRKLIVPPDLGYGDKEAGNGKIPANSTLIFELEILKAQSGSIF